MTVRDAVACLLLLALSTLVAGCWSRREINDLGVVASMGVDLTEDGEIEVTLTLALPGASPGGRPGGGGKDAPPEVMFTRTGKTIAETIRLVELSVPRRLSFHHSQAVIIGEHMANEGIDALLDFLLRSPQVRLTSHVFVLRGAKITELLQLSPPMEALQASALRELADNRAGLAVTLRDLFMARISGYQDPIVPVIELRPHQAAEPNGPASEAALEGAVVLRDGKAVTYFDRQIVRGVMWLRDKARSAIISTECPNTPNKWMSGRVTRASHRVQTTVEQGQVDFTVLVKASIHLVDLQCRVDIDNPATIDWISKEFGNRIGERILAAVDHAQAIPVDPFMFGEHVRALHPGFWRQVGPDWADTWAGARVTVNTDKVQLIHTEMTTLPAHYEGQGRP